VLIIVQFIFKKNWKLFSEHIGKNQTLKKIQCIELIMKTRWIVFLNSWNLQTYYLVMLKVTKFQGGGWSYDHGCLWIESASCFGSYSNKSIESFVTKYSIID